ncbi:hypothetical protein [Xenorhabdus griffiniae]|uniref:Immunity protein n=1 Tax=Xenorhabdus griffiniae TaxID=351672 RepID=A0ABY9XMP8_9GAMM|nr:hypothetical protein [Xenorhabdus griffiniae]MBD1226995.1 hypothetical protein [Xenorhabdus griffiniae]MBE8586123.1 hypothetical protein [Xenorhabdus griffiniae]WMV74226.1 hypothetical protein QL128_09665 [Xenorhabdus griffiniae]WNH03906.1 hypothetical protein QL112_009670 [Xenorhabdus griffiniae]
MNKNINQFEYFLVVTILCVVSLCLMGLFIYCTVKCIIWLFIGGDFLFSFEYVKKIFKASVIAGLVAGIGTWFIEYKLRK